MSFWSDLANWAQGNQTQQGWLGKDIVGAANQAGTDLGILPKKVDPNAPGSSLDTGLADQDNARIQALIAQLQNQAATGNGAWQDQLAKSTQAAMGNAEALGVSAAQNQGLNNMAARRGIENAQAGDKQREAGQAVELRSQQELGAQDILQQLLANQGAQDLTQAQAASIAAQGVRQLNAQLAANAQQNTLSAVQGGAQAAATFASKGGKVPGKAKVFGDDEKNDTVPAKLSPGEIVIPRSIVNQPNAAQLAGLFVQQTKAKEGPNFADGGSTGLTNQGQTPNLSAWNIAQLAGIDPIGGAKAAYKSMNPQEAPSIGNGGLLNLGNLEGPNLFSPGGTTGQMRDLENSLYKNAAGNGPGADIVQQEAQNSEDALMAKALAGGGNKAALAQMIGGESQAQQGLAGKAGEARQQAQMQGTNNIADVMSQERALAINIAIAKQKAAFANTMINAGIDLNQQQVLRNMMSGAGQAAGMFSKFHTGQDMPSPYESNPQDLSNLTNSNQEAYEQPFVSGMDPNSLNSPPGSSEPGTPSWDQGQYKGGMIKKKKAKKNGR